MSIVNGSKIEKLYYLKQRNEKLKRENIKLLKENINIIKQINRLENAKTQNNSNTNV